jgi:hypothetical protein
MRNFLLGFVVLTFFSCAEKKEKNTQKIDDSLSYQKELSKIDSIDVLILKSGKLASSLSYSKENGDAIQVNAHLNDNNEILKIEEKFTDSKTGNQGINSFYMNVGVVFATKEYFQDYTNKPEGEFVERLSFFDKKGKINQSLEKRVNFEEELVNIDFKKVKAKAIDIKRAQKVLNQQNEFETTFQGFVLAENNRYIVVGGRGKNAYTSAIRVSNYDGFTQFLINNEQKNINRKIKILFEIVTESNGFEYQSYLEGAFVE